MLIEARQLQKTYFMGETEVHALQDVALDVTHGEFSAISIVTSKTLIPEPVPAA